MAAVRMIHCLSLSGRAENVRRAGPLRSSASCGQWIFVTLAIQRHHAN